MRPLSPATSWPTRVPALVGKDLMPHVTGDGRRAQVAHGSSQPGAGPQGRRWLGSVSSGLRKCRKVRLIEPKQMRIRSLRDAAVAASRKRSMWVRPPSVAAKRMPAELEAPQQLALATLSYSHKRPSRAIRQGGTCRLPSPESEHPPPARLRYPYTLHKPVLPEPGNVFGDGIPAGADNCSKLCLADVGIIAHG